VAGAANRNAMAACVLPLHLACCLPCAHECSSKAPPNSPLCTHRPGRSLAISVQRLPKRRCAKQMRRSSSGDHGSLRMVGSSWFLKRSRHCLPLRPLSCAATMAHFRSPCSFTSATIRSSSSCDHGRLRFVQRFRGTACQCQLRVDPAYASGHAETASHACSAAAQGRRRGCRSRKLLAPRVPRRRTCAAAGFRRCVGHHPISVRAPPERGHEAKHEPARAALAPVVQSPPPGDRGPAAPPRAAPLPPPPARFS